MPPSRKKLGSKKEAKIREEDDKKLSELDKEIYLIQIKDLEEKITRCQNKSSELAAKNQTYKLELEQLTSDKKDIVAFLKQSLDQRADDISELQERLDGLNKARESDNRLHEEQVSQLKLQYQEMKDQLTSENIVLTGKLTSLEEFKSRREEIMAKIETLQNKLKENEAQQKETVRNMEKDNILDKDKLKKEMRQKVEEVAANFRKISNKQMSETTRRAIQENTRLTEQIDKMVEKLSLIMVENQNLMAMNGEQRLRIDILESIEKDFLRKNNGLSKLVKEQVSKIQQQTEIIKELKIFESKSDQLEERKKELQNELKQSNDKAETKQSKIEVLLEGTQELTDKFQALQADHYRLEGVLFSAANALQQCITIELQTAPEDVAKHQSSKDEVLSHILEILNMAQYITSQSTKAPAIDDHAPRSPGSVKSINEMRTASPDEDEEMRYDVGDIGLVPRLEKKVASVSVRTRAMRTIAVQTDGIYMPQQLPPRLQGTCRSLRSAACRILHDVNCYPKNFTPEIMQRPHRN